MYKAICALGVGCMLLVAGCQEKSSKEKTPKEKSPALGEGFKNNKVAEDVVLAAAEANTPPSVVKVPEIVWIENDYSKALAEAKKSNLPLIIDVWAPWCHTCLSMKQTVFKDPALAAIANQFVWLAVDSDKEVNAAMLTKFPPEAWPTFFVVDPHSESILTRHVGSASVQQFTNLLTTAQKFDRSTLSTEAAPIASSPPTTANAAPMAGDKAPVATPNTPAAGTTAANTIVKGDGARGPEEWAQRADAARAAGNLPRAASSYLAAVSRADPSWSGYPGLLVRYITTLRKQGKLLECAELAEAKVHSLTAAGYTASVADFAATADECADALPPERRKDLRQNLVTNIMDVVNMPGSLSVDDKSDALRIARELSDKNGYHDVAVGYARLQQTALDAAAKNAQTPLEKMTYSWPRCEVYNYLGEAEKLIPQMQELVVALPNEYDPPHRLAYLFKQVQKLDDAIQYAGLAAERAYGPRKARILTFMADLYADKKDKVKERDIRKQVVDLYRKLPPGQQNPEALASAEKALKAIK